MNPNILGFIFLNKSAFCFEIRFTSCFEIMLTNYFKTIPINFYLKNTHKDFQTLLFYRLYNY